MSEIEDQPPPRPNDRRPSWELVIEDMHERHRIGIERYGTPLQPGNGRNSLVDAYQEILDAAVYMRNEIEEQKERPTPAQVIEWLREALDQTDEWAAIARSIVHMKTVQQQTPA